MTNEERRRALALARRKALDYALLADETGQLDVSQLDSDALMALTGNTRLAEMWAQVAQSMKIGQAMGADDVDGSGDGAFDFADGSRIITR